MTLSRLHTTLAVLLLLMAAPVWMGGCTPARSFAMPESPPADFLLAATVFTPAAEQPSEPASVPARYILEPDATLRASIGPGSTPTTFPKPTRTLTSEQLARVWALARPLGLENGDARIIVSPENFSPPGSDGSILIEFRADEAQRSYAYPASNPHARALIDALAELAWVRPD